MQISFDLIRIILNSLKDSSQCFQQFPLGGKVAIMGSRDPGVMPQALGGVKLW